MACNVQRSLCRTACGHAFLLSCPASLSRVSQLPLALESLPLARLQERVLELDARFRKDMAALTEKYDAAQQAVRAALARRRAAGAGPERT